MMPQRTFHIPSAQELLFRSWYRGGSIPRGGEWLGCSEHCIAFNAIAHGTRRGNQSRQETEPERPAHGARVPPALN
jgi:trehalose utilization protein